MPSRSSIPLTKGHLAARGFGKWPSAAERLLGRHICRDYTCCLCWCTAAEQMRVLRQVTRRQGKYVASIEAAIQHANEQIQEVQTRKAFISYYDQQDPMHARQQLEQQQLLDLGMDAGREYARRAIGTPHHPSGKSFHSNRRALIAWQSVALPAGAIRFIRRRTACHTGRFPTCFGITSCADSAVLCISWQLIHMPTCRRSSWR